MNAQNVPADGVTQPTRVAEYVAPRTLTVGSLFSGIGGIDLGLERAGWRCVWHSEIDPYASRVLAKHWPDVPNLGDIKQIDWSTVERPDLIAGGFPCQPVSLAGRGLAQGDARWLWPEFARCLRLVRPRHALLENVPGLLVRGMGDVLADLAEIGYDTDWTCIPAAAVGAPHLRWRVFVVAHARSQQYQGGSPEERRSPSEELSVADAQCVPGDVRWTELLGGRQGKAEQAGLGGSDVAYTDGERLEERRLSAEGREHLSDASRGGGRSQSAVALVDAERSGLQGCSGLGTQWARRVFAPRREGVRGVWEPEPDVGRVAHGIPSRVDRLRCLGNAVVPQVAEWIGRELAAHIDGDA